METGRSPKVGGITPACEASTLCATILGGELVGGVHHLTLRQNSAIPESAHHRLEHDGANFARDLCMLAWKPFWRLHLVGQDTTTISVPRSMAVLHQDCRFGHHCASSKCQAQCFLCYQSTNTCRAIQPSVQVIVSTQNRAAGTKQKLKYVGPGEQLGSETHGYECIVDDE